MNNRNIADKYNQVLTASASARNNLKRSFIGQKCVKDKIITFDFYFYKVLADHFKKNASLWSLLQLHCKL